MMNALDEPSTSKTNRNAKDAGGGSSSSSSGGYRDESSFNSLFKRTFKFYKRHDVAPDFSKVLDLRCASPAQGISCSNFEPAVVPSNVILEKLGLRPISQWTVSTITHRPGMVMLNDIFEPVSHLQWIKRSLYVYAEPPGFSNVGLHMPNVRNVFKDHAKQLRWSTLGLHYDWATKIYPSSGRMVKFLSDRIKRSVSLTETFCSGEPLPEELVSLADILSQALGLGSMFADAVIVNFYGRKSSLAPHVDRSERELSPPLISISFGQTAIYLAGGTNLNDPVDAFYIRSGDVLVIHGPQRLIYHAVPRILQDVQFDKHEQPEKIVKYANENRVNITIRQVDEHK